MKELEYILLEKQNINAFQDMFPGDIKEYASGSYTEGNISNNGTKAGIFLGHADETDFYLEWLYVVPELRGKGIGTAFLNDLADMLERSYYTERIYVVCIDEKTKGFFSHMRFSFEDDDVKYQYDAKLSDMTGAYSVEIDGVKCFSEMLERDVKSINTYFENNLDVVLTVPEYITKSTFLPQSRVIMDGENVKALVLVREENDALVLPFVYSAATAGKKLVAILAQVRDDLAKEYGEDKKIRVMAINDSSKQLAEKLLPTAKCREMYLGYIDIA